MIHVVRYLHATILVKDLERTRAFYSRVLGLREIERPDLRVSGLWFGIGDQELHVVVQPDLEGDPAIRDDRHIALGVTDFEGAAGRLKELGVAFHRGSSRARPQIFLRDPDGNLIELQPV